MEIEFHAGIGRFERRGLESRPARGLRPAIWVERLEDRTLQATAVTAFPVPLAGSIGPLTLGADGNLWYERITWSGGIVNTPLSGRVGRLTPSGVVSEYPLPSGGHPISSLTAGPDGNLWFTATVNGDYGTSSSSFVARVTPSGAIAEYPLSAGVTQTSDLIVGTDGNLWFTETIPPTDGLSAQCLVGRVTPSGVVAEHALPSGRSAGNLTVGTDGNLWFTGTVNAASGPPSSGFVGRVTLSGVVSEYALSSAGYVSDLTVGPDGNLWFTATVYNPSGPPTRGRIGRVTPSGVVAEYASPSAGVAANLTVGPDGNLWFTETVYEPSGTLSSGLIGRVTPSGIVSEYALPSGGVAGDLTVGSDGNLWFTETVYEPSVVIISGLVGRLTPSGIVSEYPLAPGSSPTGDLTRGPDGDLWFVGYVTTTENPLSIFVGRVSPSGAVSDFLVSEGPPATGSSGFSFLNTSPLIVGSDGNLWFTLTENHRSSPTSSLPATGFAIERVNVAEFPIPQPPSPTITSLVRTDVRAQPTRLVLTFDAALTPSSAQNTRNYILVLSGPRGRVRPHARPVTIRRANYGAESNTVTLTLGHRLPIQGYYRVTVRGSLTGTNGTLLDGSGHGRPGTDYSALLHKSGPVTPFAARLRPVAKRKAP